VVYVPDLITCFKFGDDRFRGLASAEGQILPFPTDFDGRPYNTHTLPCERVILYIDLIYSSSLRWERSSRGVNIYTVRYFGSNRPICKKWKCSVQN